MQRILQQTRAGGETGAGEAAHARIVARDRVVDAIEIEAAAFCQYVELVGDGEVRVAPGVGEQLGELGLGRRQLDQRGRDLPEELLGRGHRIRLKRGNNLRQLHQLFNGIAFGDALRTKGQQDLAIEPAQALMHQLADAGIDGAAQDQQRAIGHVVEQRVNALVHLVDRWIEVPVDRRSHHGDDRVGSVDTGGIERRLQRLAHDFAQ